MFAVIIISFLCLRADSAKVAVAGPGVAAVGSNGVAIATPFRGSGGFGTAAVAGNGAAAVATPFGGSGFGRIGTTAVATPFAVATGGGAAVSTPFGTIVSGANGAGIIRGSSRNGGIIIAK